MMLRYGWWFALFLMLSGCGKSEDSTYELQLDKHGKSEAKEYVVGIHPLHNPRRLMDVYGPIIEYIDSHIPEAKFKLEASRNYEEFDKKLDEGHFDFAMPNPYQTVRSLKHGYRVFGKMGDDQDFRGIILVRKDSHIDEVSDLKGKAVAYPSASALAATMMPQYYLHTHGIDINKDIENRYVGSQESAILNVFRGHVAAGATWPVPWEAFSAEHPDWASQLEVKWQTATLQNNGWVVRQDIPQAIVEKFKALLIGLSSSEQGRQMLAKLPISRFESADDETYQPVRDFLTIFSAQVRPVAW
jgi:phosphonate transport system substrate-binding protein